MAPESEPSELARNVEDMDRAIQCLSIEAVESVWQDVHRKWDRIRAGLAELERERDNWREDARLRAINTEDARAEVARLEAENERLLAENGRIHDLPTSQLEAWDEIEALRERLRKIEELHGKPDEMGDRCMECKWTIPCLTVRLARGEDT